MKKNFKRVRTLPRKRLLKLKVNLTNLVLPLKLLKLKIFNMNLLSNKLSLLSNELRQSLRKGIQTYSRHSN